MDLVFDYTTTATAPADLASEIPDLSSSSPLLELRRLWELTAAYQLFVGHELANQLVPLQAFARLLLEQHREEISAEGQQMLTRLADLTRQVDRHSRQLADIGRLLREPAWGQPMPLASILHEALAEVKARLADDIGQVVWTVDVQVESVFLSRALLHTVLTQLLSNAVAALAPDRRGRIGITCTWDPFGWVLRVVDNGRGLTQEQEQVLREPFAAGRLAGAAKSRAGLGFFLVRQAVARWQGRIEVRSLMGEGTTVSLSLPEGPPEYTLESGARSQT